MGWEKPVDLKEQRLIEARRQFRELFVGAPDLGLLPGWSTRVYRNVPYYVNEKTGGETGQKPCKKSDYDTKFEHAYRNPEFKRVADDVMRLAGHHKTCAELNQGQVKALAQCIRNTKPPSLEKKIHGKIGKILKNPEELAQMTTLAQFAKFFRFN